MGRLLADAATTWAASKDPRVLRRVLLGALDLLDQAGR